MKSSFSSACAFAVLFPASLLLCAQSAPDSGSQTPVPSALAKQASQPQSPRSPGSSADTNPFPVDSTSVPVVSLTGSAAPPSSVEESTAGALLPHDDSDPAKSPDDIAASSNAGFSSSTQGMDELLPEPDTGKLRKGEKPLEPVHHADAKENESVGTYYLGLKNWQAALSRFASALVLDPENPDVYWGLAEAQRNLRQFAAAKQNYLKVIAYDPDSNHSKEAHKILRQPEFESISAAAPAASAQK